MKQFKILLCLMLIIVMSLSSIGFAGTTDETEWVIYWYICGSDLESNGGAATQDLLELFAVELPENVKVVIQTGGAVKWQNEMISADHIERYIYDSNGLALIEQLPQANMGSGETLSSFLEFANKNYPAKKTGFIMWNHGGGTVTGAASDENYDGDALTLDEMYAAFYGNYEVSEINQPLDLIGFDTCLMATVDVAYTFSDIGKYLVASQELEPGNGWYYTGIASALAKNPKMNGLELGKVICDSYVEGSKLVGTADDITLSVTNLSKVNQLLAAYDDFGKEALANACIDPSFFSHFSRIAVTTENYGGNTKEQGFTNMVDLGHLARKSSDMLPGTSKVVLDALENIVEYKVNGPYRKEATGLSCYYSYNGDINDFNGYAQLGAGEAFKHFYAYGLTGELSEAGMNYIAEMNYDSIKPLETLNNQGWEDHFLTVDTEGFATLNLGEKANDILSGVYIQLYYIEPVEGIMLLLGSDNDLFADWENGIFKDNFRGVWGAIDENLVYMELSSETDTYNLYSIPILLNGEDYNLNVAYDIESATYEIIGARKSINESGMADKNLRELVAGDVITTIHYFSDLNSDGDELITVPLDEVVVGSETTFSEVDLGDGIFLEFFELRDMQGNTIYSAPITFEVENGVITTSVDIPE